MKYCTQCGSGNTDEAAFCSQCGTKLASNRAVSQPGIGPVPDVPPAPDVRPPDQGYAPPRGQSPDQWTTPPAQTVYTPPPGAYQAPPAVDKGNSVLWLVLNIVIAVLCCCTVLGIPGTICAIIGIAFAGMAISKYNQGLADGARQNEKVAMILFFVALGLGIISTIALLSFRQFGIFGIDEWINDYLY